MINAPRLTLIGAGIGDPELLTLKAVKALKTAKVVLYDALCEEEILDFCSDETEQIFVGKRGHHQESIPQESIHFLIVKKAFEKGHVVRLKGGDPFIFGRGIEEMEYAQRFGIPTDYIPGISSILSGGHLGIPLTARGVSEGFWVVTGTKASHELAADLRCAANSNSTVVVLMGMHRLKEITQLYDSQLLSEKPIAIIQGASTKNEKYVVGTIKTIEKLVHDENITSPAVMIIGDVVKYHSLKNPMTKMQYHELTQSIE